MKAAIPNARLWMLVNGDWVKLTLRPGHELEWHLSESTDEGWRSESVWLGYEASHPCVYMHEWYAARDCDGRTSSHYSYRCPVSKLQSRPCLMADPGDPMLPEWEEQDSEQRDYTAERMGY